MKEDSKKILILLMNLTKRAPVFLFILLMGGLIHICIADPEEVFAMLLSGNAYLIGRAVGMALGFGSMLIFTNYLLGLIVSLITRSVYYGCVTTVLIGIIWGYLQTQTGGEMPYSNNGLFQIVTIGGGAMLLILQVWGKLRLPIHKTT